MNPTFSIRCKYLPQNALKASSNILDNLVSPVPFGVSGSDMAFLDLVERFGGLSLALIGADHGLEPLKKRYQLPRVLTKVDSCSVCI
jgi:hypothetical protein